MIFGNGLKHLVMYTILRMFEYLGVFVQLWSVSWTSLPSFEAIVPEKGFAAFFQ